MIVFHRIYQDIAITITPFKCETPTHFKQIMNIMTHDYNIADSSANKMQNSVLGKAKLDLGLSVSSVFVL